MTNDSLLRGMEIVETMSVIQRVSDFAWLDMDGKRRRDFDTGIALRFLSCRAAAELVGERIG
jgi:hypothetical protein